MNHWVIHMAELRHNFEMANKVINRGIIGVGWSKIADLTKYKTREDFQRVFEENYPEETRRMSIAVQVGTLYRWTCEVKAGDIAIVPLKMNDTIKIGKFKEDRPVRDDTLEPYSHTRKVEWIKDVQRSDFTKDALYSIGSALTLSQPSDLVKEELEFLIKDEKVPGVDVSGLEGEEESGDIMIWLNQLEDQLKGFIADKLRERKGYPYQEIVAGALQAIGYYVKLGPKGQDGKRDVMAYSDKLGLKDPIIRVEVKSQDSSVGVDDLSRLGGYIQPNEKGLFVSRMGFTKSAKTFANSRGIITMDGEDIINLLLENYENLPDKIKEWIPLEKVWIPKREKNVPQIED